MSPRRNSAYDKRLFLSRDLSWLDFNRRVLDEAAFEGNPLLERLKFVAITSGNLDEFFMVRVAELKRLANNGDGADPSGLRPSEQLVRIREKVKRLTHAQIRILDELLRQLEENGFSIAHIEELSNAERALSRGIFRNRILPVLTPMAVDAAHPFPLLNSGAIEIALWFDPENDKNCRAFVEVPELLPRFIAIGSPAAGRKKFILLEELIMDNLELLFPGGTICEKFAFRITRDMDLDFDDGDSVNLIQSIGDRLRERRQRDAIRLEIPAGTNGKLFKWLKKSLRIEDDLCYKTHGILHCKQLFDLIQQIPGAGMLEKEWTPAAPAELAGFSSCFDAIKAKEEILLAFPYQSFSPLVRLLEEAADDPDVLAIKQTLYRVSGNSPVVRALQRAAENGKQVTVVLELKARFDEYNNITWARKLDRSGAHVVYGIAGLKVHSKMLMIVRRENEQLNRYIHLGTGNYNDKTALQYTDCGILSCDPTLCADVANLFNVLTGVSTPGIPLQLTSAAPFNLRKKFETLVMKEIEHVNSGRPGRIIAKMNSLSDEKMIRLLHLAADAGVEIDLIVRGICCYRPLPEQENIRIYSIVDRFLEHSRIYYFGNAGDGEYYLSSADWMTRNLDHRVELLFPVQSEKNKIHLKNLLEFELEDSYKRRRLTSSGIYIHPKDPDPDKRSQYRSWCYFRELARQELLGVEALLKRTPVDDQNTP